MPTESAAGEGVALFLFAHQDDEFAVFHTLEACRRRGQRVVCAYLTRGRGAIAQQRNAESRRVLASLGIGPGDIVFAGDALGIDDASLPEHLPAASAWLGQWFASFPAIALVCVTAWEGGHHDHDALHALAAQVAHGMGLLPRLRQFSLYHRHACPGPFFKVLAPLAANGKVESHPIPVRRRVAYLLLCLRYPSQRGTWIGLFPFVLLHYLLRGVQTLQPVSLERLAHRPHAGALYYERRRFYRWECMQERLRELRGP